LCGRVHAGKLLRVTTGTVAITRGWYVVTEGILDIADTREMIHKRGMGW
jgi:hypothetical protein